MEKAARPDGTTHMVSLGFIVYEWKNKPVEFAYDSARSATDNHQKYVWCRFCGATITSAFAGSPWGPKKLCATHNKQWYRGQLRLPESEPLQPMDVSKSSTPKYLHYCGKHNVVPNVSIPLSKRTECSSAPVAQ